MKVRFLPTLPSPWCFSTRPLVGAVSLAKGDLALKSARATDKLQGIGDDFLRLKPPSLFYRKPPIVEPKVVMQLLRNIRIYPSEEISQRHTDITANAFSSCQLPCKIRNPAKDIIANLGDLIAVKRPHCFGVNPNFSITHSFINACKSAVVICTTISGGGFGGLREHVLEGFCISLGLFCFGGIDKWVHARKGFHLGGSVMVGDFKTIAQISEHFSSSLTNTHRAFGSTSSGLDADVPPRH